MNVPFLTRYLADETQTLTLGGCVGAVARGGDFIALYGGLGAGKTTFARGFIQAFVGERIEVPSPTFTLVQTYARTKLTQPPLDLFHFDLYRLKNGEEVWELGWEDIAGGVALVEWPDKAVEYLPKDRLDIAISPQNGGREITFCAANSNVWKDRLNGV